MKYLPLLFLLLAGCVTEPHSGQDCADQGNTNAHFGIIGLAASIHCYGTADNSGNKSEPTRIVYSEQLIDLIPNSTYSGKSDGTEFDVYSRQDGRMSGRTARGSFDEGTWEITSDGKYCRQWNKWRDASRDCFYVYLIEDDTFQFKGIGNPYKSVGRIVPGDPELLAREISTPEGAPLVLAAIAASSAAVNVTTASNAVSEPGNTASEPVALSQDSQSDDLMADSQKSGVNVASGVAGAAAVAGRRQQTTKHATPKQSVTTREAQSEHLRVAVLPFAAKFPTSNSAILTEDTLMRFSSSFLSTQSELEVTYSYYQPKRGGRPELNPTAIWEGSLEKRPKRLEIYSVADELDADIALTYFHTQRTGDWTAYELYSVDVYVFDLIYERMYHGRGDERDYKKVTARLFDELLEDRRRSEEKGT